MKYFLKISTRFILIGLVIACLAEGVCRFFLPAPILPRLPMLKQVADPIVGYRLLPNQKAYSLDSLVTTNQWGYRGRDWTIEKPSHTFRIAILGASLTFGHGIEDHHIYTDKLEELLNANPPQPGIHYEVLNFGVGGYDIGHSLHVLKQDVLKFKPDMILLSLFMGDVFYVKDYSFYPEFFRLQDQNFSRLRWEFLNFCRQSRLAMYLWDKIKDHLWGREPNEVDEMIQRYAIQGLSPLEGPNAEGWNFIVARLKEYGDIAADQNIPAVFLVLPPHEEISDPNAVGTYAEYLKKKCADFGIHYIGFLEQVRQNQKMVESFFIPYDFHFKKEGHAWIATILAKQLNPIIAAPHPRSIPSKEIITNHAG